MYVRRIPLENVPYGDDQASEWLQNLFREKDRIIDSFHTTGSFFKTSGFREVPSRRFLPRFYTLFNFAIWFSISITLIVYFLLHSLQSRNWMTFFIAVCILATSKYNS